MQAQQVVKLEDELLSVANSDILAQSRARKHVRRVFQEGEAPKFLANIDFGAGRREAIVKIDTKADGVNQCRLEHACQQLVNAARSEIGDSVPGYNPESLEMAPARLSKSGNKIAFQRFDVDKNGRTIKDLVCFADLVGSANSLSDFSSGELSYTHMTKLFSESTGRDQGPEMFTRLITNIALSNTDDHVRNHALMLDTKTLRIEMTPVYDVVTQPGWGASSALMIGPFGNEAGAENLRLAAKDMLGEKWEEKAAAITRACLRATQDWSLVFQKNGLSSEDCKKYEQSIERGQKALERFSSTLKENERDQKIARSHMR